MTIAIEITVNDGTSVSAELGGAYIGEISDTQHGDRGGGTLHSAATTSVAGFMSAADKTKLDGLGSSSSTPAQITGDEDDYVLPTNSMVRLSTDASRTISGMVPRGTTDALCIINVGANNLVLGHQDTGSVAANRMISPTAADLTLGADEYAYLWYDDVTTRWRILETNGV